MDIKQKARETLMRIAEELGVHIAYPALGLKNSNVLTAFFGTPERKYGQFSFIFHKTHVEWKINGRVEEVSLDAKGTLAEEDVEKFIEAAMNIGDIIRLTVSNTAKNSTPGAPEQAKKQNMEELGQAYQDDQNAP